MSLIGTLSHVQEQVSKIGKAHDDLISASAPGDIPPMDNVTRPGSGGTNGNPPRPAKHPNRAV